MAELLRRLRAAGGGGGSGGSSGNGGGTEEDADDHRGPAGRLPVAGERCLFLFEDNQDLNLDFFVRVCERNKFGWFFGRYEQKQPHGNRN